MRIWLDPALMQARGLTVQRRHLGLAAAKRAGHRRADRRAAGDRTQTSSTRSNVAGRLTDAAQFEDIIVKTGADGAVTRIRDIGHVELGAQTYAPGLHLERQAGRGHGDLPVARRQRADRDEGSAGEDGGAVARRSRRACRYDIPFDTTKFVSASVDEVYKTLIEAGVLVLIVILVFLQDIRATLVPATTVPVTIIGAFAAMAALGFTINLSTLFAIVLAIGIVVDDAIVVVEGAAHYVEAGLSGHDAAIKAMNELFGPIIGITLVLMSVFIPAAFLPGLTGKLYAQFALVIAATALISAINAATLKPTQCALWLRPAVPMEKRNAFYRGFNRVYGGLERWYVRLVGGHDAMERRDGHSGAARDGRRPLWSVAAAHRVPAAGRPGLFPGLACNCPTAPRWTARRRSWRRCRRRSARCPACRMSSALPASRCSTTARRCPTPASPTSC